MEQIHNGAIKSIVRLEMYDIYNFLLKNRLTISDYLHIRSKNRKKEHEEKKQQSMDSIALIRNNNSKSKNLKSQRKWVQLEKLGNQVTLH